MCKTEIHSMIFTLLKSVSKINTFMLPSLESGKGGQKSHEGYFPQDTHYHLVALPLCDLSVTPNLTPLVELQPGRHMHISQQPFSSSSNPCPQLPLLFLRWASVTLHFSLCTEPKHGNKGIFHKGSLIQSLAFYLCVWTKTIPTSSRAPASSFSLLNSG